MLTGLRLGFRRVGRLGRQLGQPWRLHRDSLLVVVAFAVASLAAVALVALTVASLAEPALVAALAELVAAEKFAAVVAALVVVEIFVVVALLDPY